MATEPRNNVQSYFHVQTKGVVKRNTFPSLVPLKAFGPLHVSGKLPTYPSPKPTFYPKREVSVNIGFGEG